MRSLGGSLVVLLSFAVAGGVNEARSTTAQEGATVSGDWTADLRGAWTGADGEPRLQFNLRSEAGDGQWGFGIRADDLRGLPPSAFSGVARNVSFSWTREAGTLRFTGSFDAGRGSGHYTFVATATFLASMAGLGTLDADTLIRVRIHQVTPEFLRGLAARGYPDLDADTAIRMKIHRVSLDEIDQLKGLGFGELAPDDLVRFRIHRVTPAFIREMRDAGFTAATEEQLVRLRIHQVDGQFVRDARADGYLITTPGDAVDLAIRGPRYTRVRKQR